MSAHVLLNLLNKLGKKIRCKALPEPLLLTRVGCGSKETLYRNLALSYLVAVQVHFKVHLWKPLKGLFTHYIAY